MLHFPGFQITGKLHESATTLVLRAKQECDGLPVILKILNIHSPGPEALAQFDQEFSIASSLKTKGVMKANELTKAEGKLLIIYEDFGGEFLQQIIQAKPLSIEEGLSVAIKIIDCLNEVHAANLIHKDINPGNIICNEATGELKLTGFGLTGVLGEQRLDYDINSQLMSSLAYISPEQTGRMNRTIDHRSDFYSFGVTLYEMLVGEKPFSASDPLEMVHSHIAKPAPLACEQRASVPVQLSRIIKKLLEKNA